MYMDEQFNEYDFLTDDEKKELEDVMLDSICEEILKDQSKTSVLNIKRVEEFDHVYKILKNISRGNRATVTYKINAPFVGMGSISVISRRGSSLTFRNPKLFNKAIELADNYEVYPKTNGSVVLTFTFYKLTNIIE